jgi:signal transduction histidine kinase
MVTMPPTTPYQYLYLGLCTLAVGSNCVLIYILSKRNKNSLTITSYILFLIFISLWGIATIAITAFPLPANIYEYANDMGALGYVTMPIWFLIFAYSYVKKEKQLLEFKILLPLLSTAFLFLFLSWHTNLIKGQTLLDTDISIWGPQTKAGPLYPFFLVWLLGLLLYSLKIIYEDYKASLNPLRKIQGKYIILALFIPLSIGAITDGMLPIMRTSIFPATIPFSSITNFITGYAILKYGLFQVSSEDILASVKIPMITIGVHNEIRMINDAALSLLKLKRRDMHSITLSKVIQNKNFKTILSKVFAEGKKVQFKHLYIVSATGEIFHLPAQAIPVLSDNKVQAVNIVFDLQHDSKRTFEKDEIISIASHEIKTPLTSISLIAQLLQRSAKERGDNVSYEYLSKMNTQLSNMTNLIHDFMDVTRIGKGELKIQRGRVDINALILQAVETMEKIAKKRQIITKMKHQLFITGDRERLFQVFTNIISNAIKYSPDGSSIFIRTKREKQFVCIEVEDEGFGISKEEQKNIFKSFYRSKTTNGNAQGLGVGLYIVKQIIEKHKGKIVVASRHKKGTIFKITLPV